MREEKAADSSFREKQKYWLELIISGVKASKDKFSWKKNASRIALMEEIII